MKLRRVLSREFDHQGDGFSVRAAINTVVAANVDEREGETSAASDADKNQTSEAEEVQDE